MSNSTKNLLSGNNLRKYILEYLKSDEIDPNLVRIDTFHTKLSTVHIVRSEPFEDLITRLTDMAESGNLSLQHDIVKVFMGVILLNLTLDDLEVENEYGTLIDLISGLIPYELKTKRNVDHHEISAFITEYYNKMIKSRKQKHIWWLGFLNKLDISKLKKGRNCIRYLILIELDMRKSGMSIKNQHNVIADAQQVVDQAVQTIMEKDGMDDDEGVLFPVKNVWITDKLRDIVIKEKSEKEAALSEVAEQARVIEERDSTVAEQAKVIEELRKKLLQQSNSK